MACPPCKPTCIIFRYLSQRPLTKLPGPDSSLVFPVLQMWCHTKYQYLMQANAEDAVKQMLIGFSEEQKLPEVGTVVAEDQMDDGTPIRVGLSLCA